MTKYIDADALMQQRPENLNPTYIDHDIAQYNRGWNACNELWVSLIKELPAADVELMRHGEWIKMDVHSGMEQYKCSVCDSTVYVPECMGKPLYSYCPVCGSKIEGGSECDHGGA